MEDHIKHFSAHLSDDLNGKTALLKALLNLRGGNNDTVEVFLDIAARTGDLEDLVNASYKDPFYKGGSSWVLKDGAPSPWLMKFRV